jgi:spore cortex biosynthesis protein YabQ
MILPVNIQLYYFLSTIIAGFAVGIMFDIYRIIRGFNSPSKVMTAISDMLFWILAALITFIFFMYTNNGDLGYYTFVGLIAGLFIYFKAVSRRFLKLLRWIVYYILKFLRFLMLIIVYPIKLIRYGIGYLILKTRGFANTKMQSCSLSIKKNIKKLKIRRKNKINKEYKSKNTEEKIS